MNGSLPRSLLLWLAARLALELTLGTGDALCQLDAPFTLGVDRMPSSRAQLVIHNHTNRATTPPRVPYVLL